MAQQDDRVVVEAYRRAMVRRRLAAATVAARTANVRRWLTWSDDWRAAGYRDVEDWIAARAVGLGASRNLLTQLRAFYRWAMRDGLTGNDPTVMVERFRSPRYLPRPAGEADIVGVLAEAPTQIAAMVALMAGGGLRCCEVSRLNWVDVDMLGGLVRVVGKGDNIRLVAIAPEVIEYVARLDGHRGAVFVGPSGRRVSPARVSQVVGQAFRAAGSPVTAHQLRHRFATKALRVEGSDLGHVRDALGHANISTTTVYTKIADDVTQRITRSVGLPVTRGSRDSI